MRWVGFFLLVFGGWLSAETRVRVMSLDSRLTLSELMWESTDGLEARGWWSENGGSAWARIGNFQVGPLKASSRLTPGQRTWGPTVDALSGTWGAAWSGNHVDVWMVQNPEILEAGGGLFGQGATVDWALSANRSWDLETQDREVTDQVRVGVTWRSDFGVEQVQQQLTRTTSEDLWETRWASNLGSGAWDWVDSGRCTVGVDGLVKDWRYRVRASLSPFALGSRFTKSEPRGDWRSEWGSPLGSLFVLAGERRGYGGGWKGETHIEGVAFETSLEGRWRGTDWTTAVQTSGSFRWNGQRIVVRPRWIWTGSESKFRIDLTASQGPWKVSVRWSVSGQQLGWIQPNSSFRVILDGIF